MRIFKKQCLTHSMLQTGRNSRQMLPICRFSFSAIMHARSTFEENFSYGKMSIRRKETPLSIPMTLLLGLEIVEQDRSLLRLLAPILDDDARAVDNFACVSLTVQHTFNSMLVVIYSMLIYIDYSHKPAHSPNCFPSGTLIKGILCSEHNATTNFLYASSSQASLRTHMCACRLSNALEASRRPRARPSCIRASFKTPLRASRTDI